jgi:hypothetical protein
MMKVAFCTMIPRITFSGPAGVYRTENLARRISKAMDNVSVQICTESESTEWQDLTQKKSNRKAVHDGNDWFQADTIVQLSFSSMIVANAKGLGRASSLPPETSDSLSSIQFTDVR